MRLLTAVVWLALLPANQAFAPLSQQQHNWRLQRHEPFYNSVALHESASVEKSTDDMVERVGHQHETEAFENKGLFSWMQPYMQAFGFVEGRTLYGVVPLASGNRNTNPPMSEQEVAEKRAQAARDMVNIGTDERERRAKLGQVLAVVTAVYMVWSALIADDGGFSGHVLRFLSVIPLFFSFGLTLSAESGL